MSKTANIFARVEPEVKENAEAILDSLGISMSNAVSMFLRQVIIQKGIPFEVRLDVKKPLCMGDLTKEQFDAEMEKGMEDIREGRLYTLEEVDEKLEKIFIKDEESLNAALEKGYAECLEGKAIPAEQVFEELHKEFGI